MDKNEFARIFEASQDIHQSRLQKINNFEKSEIDRIDKLIKRAVELEPRMDEFLSLTREAVKKRLIPDLAYSDKKDKFFMTVKDGSSIYARYTEAMEQGILYGSSGDWYLTDKFDRSPRKIGTLSRESLDNIIYDILPYFIEYFNRVEAEFYNMLDNL